MRWLAVAVLGLGACAASEGPPVTSSSAASEPASGAEATPSDASDGARLGSTSSREPPQLDTTEPPASERPASDASGHAPEEEMARARRAAAPVVTIERGAVAGISWAEVEAALAPLRDRLGHCLPDGGVARARIDVGAGVPSSVDLQAEPPLDPESAACLSHAIHAARFDGASGEAVLTVRVTPR